MKASVIVGVVASALLLVGCAAPVVRPLPPTDADIVATQQKILDATYDLHSFTTQRLETAPAAADPTDGGFGRCLEDGGFDTSKGFGSSLGVDGFSLSGINAAEVSAADQLLGYECLAKYPQDVTQMGMVYSDSQREYLWDYNRRWVIPCLQSHGYRLLDEPTHSEAMENYLYPWSPYDAIDIAALTDAMGQEWSFEWYTRIEQECGPRLGMIEQ